jgi:hypothetical protein
MVLYGCDTDVGVKVDIRMDHREIGWGEWTYFILLLLVSYRATVGLLRRAQHLGISRSHTFPLYIQFMQFHTL